MMKRKRFGSAGALAALLISALAASVLLTLAGCDNGSTTNKEEYHLKWAAPYTPYSTIESTIASQGWVVTNRGSDYALLSGSAAASMYDYYIDSFTQGWGGGGDVDGSFEACINFSKDGVSAPSGLKTAGANNKGNIPLAGVFANGTGVILLYITKN
jgi:hypothetical protein